MSRKFTIDGDMLGLLYFINMKAGPQVGLNGGAHEIREIHEELKPEHVEDHIVSIALECLGYSRQIVLCAWVAGVASLTPEFKQWLYSHGWLYGDVLPEKVVKQLQFYNEYVYRGMFE